VYLRWYLWKVGLERAQWYLINGLTMTVVFFLCRNAYGLGAHAVTLDSNPTSLHSLWLCSVRATNHQLDIMGCLCEACDFQGRVLLALQSQWLYNQGP